jgi:hypothetical protein
MRERRPTNLRPEHVASSVPPSRKLSFLCWWHGSNDLWDSLAELRLPAPIIALVGRIASHLGHRVAAGVSRPLGLKPLGDVPLRCTDRGRWPVRVKSGHPPAADNASGAGHKADKPVPRQALLSTRPGQSASRSDGRTIQAFSPRRRREGGEKACLPSIGACFRGGGWIHRCARGDGADTG